MRKWQNKFQKIIQNCNLSPHLNFRHLHLEMRNSKGRSGYSFDQFFIKLIFPLSLRNSLKRHRYDEPINRKLWISILAQKNVWVHFLKILWETDKVNFINSNLMCVYTLHTHHISKYEIMFVCFPQTFQIMDSKLFWCQNR